MVDWHRGALHRTLFVNRLCHPAFVHDAVIRARCSGDAHLQNFAAPMGPLPSFISRVLPPQTVVPIATLLKAFRSYGLRGRLRQRAKVSRAARTELSLKSESIASDAADAVVELRDVTVRRGPNDVLTDVSMKISPGARAVIVGANGCGKTTLLNAIASSESFGEGRVRVNVPSIGWLRQEALSGSSRSVLDEAVLEMPAQFAYEKLEQAREALNLATGDSSRQQEEFEAATEEFEMLGGYDFKTRAINVLAGLGFKANGLTRPCSELSGGWQMRVALARALLREPALLLLDEPTNHMDAQAKSWLAKYLADGLPAETTLLLVTHDRALLEEIKCTEVLEITSKRILPYKVSSIAEWEKRRAARAKSLEIEMSKLQRTIQNDESYIKRFGAKASHASRAGSKKKTLAKNEKELRSLEDALIGLPSKAGKANDDESLATLPLAGPSKVNLQLPDAPLKNNPPRDDVLLSLKDAKVGYIDTAAAVIGNIQLDLRKGARIALLGPNGCGKSTLLRSLAGTLELRDGVRRVGVGNLRRAKVALFTQDLAQDLPSDVTPVDYLLGDDAPLSLTTEGARKALGALGLRGEVHLSEIGTLSGGEKARVALAVFATRPADVLLLDEPTNHLDGAAVAALSAALHAHNDGAVVVASHDSAFIDALDMTSTVVVTPGSEERAGFIEMREALIESSTQVMQEAAAAASLGEDEVPISAPKVLTGKQLAKQAKGRHFAEKRLMKKIEDTEAKLEEAEQNMNMAYSQEAFEEYEEVRIALEALYERWEDLSATT